MNLIFGVGPELLGVVQAAIVRVYKVMARAMCQFLKDVAMPLQHVWQLRWVGLRSLQGWWNIERHPPTSR